MSEFKMGQEVKHRDYGFIGKVHGYSGSEVTHVKITDPASTSYDAGFVYSAFTENLEAVEFETGQEVEHVIERFKGKVVENKGNFFNVEITDPASSGYPKGYIYSAFSENLKAVEKKPATTLSINVETNFSTVMDEAKDLHEVLVDVEDELTEIRLEAEALSGLRNEQSVFEADFQGFKFKGTQADFKHFVDGMITLSRETK